jgi:hypothetical protein
MPPSLKIWVEEIPNYTVTIYGKLTEIGGPGAITFEYSLDGGTNWSSAGSSFDSTTCISRGSFSVVSGNSASIRASDGVNTYKMNRTLNSTTCPGSPYNSCEVLVSNVTSDRNVAITVDINATCP